MCQALYYNITHLVKSVNDELQLPNIRENSIEYENLHVFPYEYNCTNNHQRATLAAGYQFLDFFWYLS